MGRFVVEREAESTGERCPDCVGVQVTCPHTDRGLISLFYNECFDNNADLTLFDKVSGLMMDEP